MSVFSSPRYTRHSFTLVEMLTVIVIIGILAGLITAAATRARYRAKVTVIHAELEQLEMALHAYKEKFGEFPPDFTNQQAVLRHLRKAFPRYSVADWATLEEHVSIGWGVDIDTMGPHTALMFWLGGMPEFAASGVENPVVSFRGFSANPTNPFDYNSSLSAGPNPNYSRSRVKPFFEFDPNRIGLTNNNLPLRYYSPGCEGSRDSDRVAPVVYFRAENGQYPTASKYWTSGSITVFPYCDSRVMLEADMNANTNPVWVNPKTFQILSPGLDRQYYSGSNAQSQYYFPNSPNSFDDDHRFDDMANFTPGTIEDAMD